MRVWYRVVCDRVGERFAIDGLHERHLALQLVIVMQDQGYHVSWNSYLAGAEGGVA